MHKTIGTLWVIVTCAASSGARADLIVDGGTLSVGCINPFGNAFQFITQIPNPLVASRTAMMHNSIAQAAYQFNWDLATGHFHIDGNLASEGGNGGPLCATENRVNFHITNDTLLSIDSEWTYQFNGGIRTSEIRFFVGDAVTSDAFWFRGDVGDTVAGDPPTDTFHVGGSVLLTPGNYFFRSIMDLRAVGGSPNSVSTAHGFANITLTTVPEPAAMGMLAFAAVVMRRKRRSMS